MVEVDHPTHADLIDSTELVSPLPVHERIGIGIIILQIPFSAWWLSRFRFGPVEWIWRRLTYGRPL